MIVKLKEGSAEGRIFIAFFKGQYNTQYFTLDTQHTIHNTH